MPVRAPIQPDLVPTEDWRSLHLDIQVRVSYFSSCYLSPRMSRWLTSRLYPQHESIRTVQDTLAHISQPQSVQASTSDLGNTNQQVLIEDLPPVLVLHLNRVRYDAAAGGVTKIRKSIQFGPDLEIPPGTIFSFLAVADQSY